MAPAYRQSANLTETKLSVTKNTKTKSSERLHNPTTSPETSAVAARLQRGGNAASAGWQRCNRQITRFCLKKHSTGNVTYHFIKPCHICRGNAAAARLQRNGKGAAKGTANQHEAVSYEKPNINNVAQPCNKHCYIINSSAAAAQRQRTGKGTKLT